MVFMSAENIGVGHEGWPTMISSVWTTLPFLTMRVRNSGTLSQTWNSPMSAGTQRQRSMLMRMRSILESLVCATGAGLGPPLSTCRVPLPTIPSGRSPLEVWNSFTAVCSASS